MEKVYNHLWGYIDWIREQSKELDAKEEIWMEEHQDDFNFWIWEN